MSRPGKKRLAVDIGIEWHKELKKCAEKRNTTISKIITRLIVRYINEERRYD